MGAILHAKGAFSKVRPFSSPKLLRFVGNLLTNPAFMKLTSSLLAVILLVAAGCHSPGRKLDPILMSQIQEGTTTRAEVESIFGAPKCVLTGANQKTLTRHNYQVNRPNPGWRGVAEGNAGSILLRSLTALYGSNQVVEKLLFNESSTVVRRTRDGILIGWSPDNVDFTKIIKNITSHGELLLWYGAPTVQTLTIDGERLLCWGFHQRGAFAIQRRDQEFQVILDEDNFVKNFAIMGNTDVRPHWADLYD